MTDETESLPSTNVIIRRAEREDMPTLMRLIEALADFEKLPPPDEAARARMLAHGWPTNGEKPLFIAWLAYVQAETTSDLLPVAYAITFETYSSFLARPTLYMEDLFVLPAFRRHGIGTAFLEHLHQEAQARGCGRMEWVVLDWNTDAQAFYQRHGAQHLPEWHYYRKVVGSSEDRTSSTGCAEQPQASR